VAFQARQYAAAAAHARQAVLIDSQFWIGYMQLAQAAEQMGQNEAREVLRQLESDSRERYVPPAAMALVHAGLGEREAVIEWLVKAYDARDVHLIYLPVDPKWDPYRSDPRFQALVTRCGFTPSTSVLHNFTFLDNSR
jgi:hypothetical protein